MYPPRQLLAYATVSVFLVFVLFYGAAESLRGTTNNVSSKDPGRQNNAEEISTLHPDFNNYIALRKLTLEEFPLKAPNRRIIIIGDLHGMDKPFHKLVDHLDYQPSKDVLIHVGDILTKGSHKGSLAILDYMSSRNITGVRGNHDQKVVEWRAWIDWISSKSAGKEWLESLEKRWHASQSSQASEDTESWLKSSDTAADRNWLSLIPKGWDLFGDHYRLARDISDEGYRYLLGLPLRLYIPSAHAFIVHAGLLPSNPTYEMDDKHNQPLARIPAFPKRPAEDSTYSILDGLRHIQEIGILTEIPQNTDPWVVLNMRSVIGDTVSRKSKEGRPWSKIWNEHMDSCVGFQKTLEDRSSTSISAEEDEEGDGSNHWEDKKAGDSIDDTTVTAKKVKLPCYPSTTIYGHAAGRGLDVKRWSIGLDSGCVYDEKLTALILGGSANKNGGASYDDDPPSSEKNRDRWIPFGDKGRAKIVSVKC